MNNYLLIGNPNVGKTTIFNSLTGSNERVSNFEGVTVAKKENTINGSKDILIDLPGTNNLNDGSLTSLAVNQTLLKDEYNGILYVADINNLKKNMYLFLDLLESGININLILNMDDLFEGDINIDSMKKQLNINVISTNKKNKLNINDIKKSDYDFKLEYGTEIESLIDYIISFRNEKYTKLNNRFLALQCIKGNEEVHEFFNSNEKIVNKIKIIEEEIIKNNKAKSLTGYIFKVKREFILSFLNPLYKREKTNKKMAIIGDKIDKIALHKFWGYVLFAFIMWLIFLISFNFSFLQDITDGFLQNIFGFITNILVANNVSDVFIDFLNNGVFSGLGAIIVFLPQIIILFLLLTLLEGSGYLSRVSVLFENLFNKMGLSANSLIPLISGLGCNVLSIISTRNIKDEPRRISTILASPFISCSARFPVYLIFIDIFFQKYKALILLFLYLLGIVIAIMVAFVTDKVIYKNKSQDIAISFLPSYKMISLKYLSNAIINKIKGFLLKAGKFIFLGTIFVWLLSHFSLNGYTNNVETSILFTFSSGIAYLLVPLGFGTIEASASLFAAFFAKELAISTMVVMYGAGTVENLSNIISVEFTTASALSFMVFTLLYIPCISTLGTIYAETKSKKITFISVVLSLSIGYVASFIIYHLVQFL